MLFKKLEICNTYYPLATRQPIINLPGRNSIDNLLPCGFKYGRERAFEEYITELINYDFFNKKKKRFLKNLNQFFLITITCVLTI